MSDGIKISKRLVVLGAGESGVGAAILGKQKKYEVFVSDRGTISHKYKDVLLKENIPFEETKHTKEQILNADVVVKSPGISDSTPLIMLLRSQGTQTVSYTHLRAHET